MNHHRTRSAVLRAHAAALAILALGSACPIAGADVVFVNAGQPLPTALQNGTSWAFAFKSLQTALTEASAGDDIWVAKGTYAPTTTASQTASFTPPDDVRVLGGFVIGDALESDRDPVLNLTILTGEIGAAGAADNSMHVMRATNVSGTDVDGFTIVNGNADGSGADLSGGALLVEGAAGSTDLLFRRCNFVSNSAVGSGGAVSTLVGGTSFVDCTFRLNNSNNGGAFDGQNGAVTLVNCRFLGNDGISGGALRLVSADGSALHNCLFSGNAATASGGAILLATSDTLLFACTIVNNEAGASGGGIRMDTSMTAALRNTIVFDNVVNGASSQIVVGTGVLFQKFFCDIEGVTPETQGNFSSDPLFVNALGPDGVAGTLDDDLQLRPSSPCIDRGDTSVFIDDLADLDEDGTTAEALPLDLAGNPRKIDDIVDDEGGGSVKFHDVGAFEFKRAGTVRCVDASAAAGGDGTTWAKAFTSLQDALAITNTQTLVAPVQIWIANGTYKPTTSTDRSKSFTISKSVAIYGGFGGGEGSLLDRFPQLNDVTLSGNIGAAGDADNSFHVIDINTLSVNSEVLIDAVYVMHGNAEGAPGSSDIGGGIRIAGGAGSKATIRNCRLFDNHAPEGGGVDVKGPASAALINCHVAGNSATSSAGGARVHGSNGVLTLTNCTVLGNTAQLGGGVVALLGTQLAVQNSILYFNSDSRTVGEGEQIIALTGSASMAHCCVQCLGLNSTLPPSVNCNGANPRLGNPIGNDNVFGTFDDQILLQSHSPCIDAGSTALLPLDSDDMDEDGLDGVAPGTEALPFDISVQAGRVKDDTAVANGPGGDVDIGAIERQSASSGSLPIPSDLDGSGSVGATDLAILLGAFGTSGPVGDIDGSCNVDSADLAILLGAWSE